MAVLTDSGRAAIAGLIKDSPIHMAWGSGSVSWDDTPVPESVGATSLLNEIGRRNVAQAIFCTPSESGGLVVPDGRFEPSATPTKWLYLRFAFDFSDSPEGTVREIAVISGTVAKPTVPEGQEYLLPTDILTAGQMLVIEHIPAMERNSSVRQQFEFVIQF